VGVTNPIRVDHDVFWRTFSKASRHWAMFAAKHSATALYGSGPFAVFSLLNVDDFKKYG
jgi:hypothetical protein